MINVAYAAGKIKYISTNKRALLLDCAGSLVQVHCDEDSYTLDSKVVVLGKLQNDMTVKADTVEVVDRLNPTNLLVFDGKIGRGKGQPMLIKVGKDFIHPTLVATEPPKNSSKLKPKNLRRIVAYIDYDSKLELMKAVEI